MSNAFMCLYGRIRTWDCDAGLRRRSPIFETSSVVASNPVRRRLLEKLRFVDRAVRPRDWTARMKPAAGRWFRRARHVSFEDDPVAPSARIRDRNRRDERLRIRVFRRVSDRPRISHLDQFAEVHDANAVAD